MSYDEMYPWPPMPDVIVRQLEAIAKEDDEAEEEEKEGEGEEQPPPGVNPHTGEVLTYAVRPWDLTMLDDDLRPAVFAWLDDVVMWLNSAYAWQEEFVIPACWQRHTGLAHDLAAIAFGRLDVYQTPTAAYVGRWHSDLDDFLRRMAAALGSTARDCRRGDHAVPSQYAVDLVRSAINSRRK